MRPIEKGEPVGAVKDFMKSYLKLSQDFIDNMGPIKVQRVPAGPSARIRNEAIVFFGSSEVRDSVRSSARNLAGLGSNYGIRLELPNYLKTHMNALQSASYEIKTKYAQAGMSCSMTTPWIWSSIFA